MRRPAYLMVPLALICAMALVACGGAAATPPPAPLPTAPPTGTATPAEATATPAEATATPAEVTATPAEVTATPAEVTATPAEVTATPAEATATPTTPSVGSEILFLRDGSLIALDVATGAERSLADGVSDVAATPDGRRIALVRGQGAAAEIWLLGRDGADLRQLTSNDRVESGLSWSPDGLSLTYAAASGPAPRAPDWPGWGEWCAAAEVRITEVSGGPERTLGAGCEPAFSPDGRRIAFTTPPASEAAGASFPGAANTITIVNRQGEHGWSVAQSGGNGELDGYLVHGPAWSPDGDRIGYQRFLGYQALTDMNLTEVSSSYRRSGEPVAFGAGWLLTPVYAPAGDRVVVVEHNFSDARGFSGYDIWGLTVMLLGEEQELILPSATLTLQAATLDILPRATGAAWSPDGAALAVALPAGWRPGLGNQEPAFAEQGPAELWRWRPGAPPEEQLAEGLDFASPLLWLPPPPTVAVREAGVALAMPAGWDLRAGTADYLIADGPDGRVIAARLIAGGPPGGPEGLFPELLATSVGLDDPVIMPDGSMLRGASGNTPDGRRLAGLLRLSADGSVAALYLATPEQWPTERARAMALLGAP